MLWSQGDWKKKVEKTDLTDMKNICSQLLGTLIVESKSAKLGKGLDIMLSIILLTAVTLGDKHCVYEATAALAEAL